MKNLTTTKWPIWVTLSLAIASGLSLYCLIPRFQVEQENRAVGIVVESDTVFELAASQGLSLEQGLEQLAEAVGEERGLIISSTEQTGNDYINSNLVQALSLPDGSYEITGRQWEMSQLRKFWEARYGPIETSSSGYIIPSLTLLKNLPVGLPIRDVKAAHNGGFEILARMSNPIGANSRYISFVINDVANFGGARFYLPSGDQVLGAPGLIENTSQALVESKINYVTAEFVKTVGDSSLATQEPTNTIRLHAAQAAELVRMSKPAIVERYVKAGRERNIRLLLIRPAVSASENALEDFAGLIASIRVGLEKEGMAIRSPRPFTEPKINSLLFALIGLALIPAIGFCLLSFWGSSIWGRALSFGGASIMGLMFLSPSMREVAVLANSIIMPILAYIWFFSKPSRNLIIGLVGVSSISLVGGLPIAATLVGLPYMLHLNIFTGVKLSVFLPIFVIAFICLTQVVDWRSALKEPIIWGSALASIALLGGLAYMSIRTGNDSPGAVSGLELKFRDILDRWLIVRPRTKEFLIGHPLLFIGIGLWKRANTQKLKGIAAVLLAAGAIGQTSIVNTLCHLHTPIHLSLMRIFIGLIFGCILGALGWILLARFMPKSTGEEK